MNGRNSPIVGVRVKSRRQYMQISLPHPKYLIFDCFFFKEENEAPKFKLVFEGHNVNSKGWSGTVDRSTEIA